MTKAPRTERLLALLLLLLQKQHPLSRSDIREMVKDYPADVSDEAFEKMFERDKDELRSHGFPIETVEIVETEGTGYLLRNSDAQLEPVEFTAPEKAALSLAARLWSSGVNQFDATHALKKLESTSPAERFDTTAPLEYVSQDATVQLDLMRAVDLAATSGQVLNINYRKPSQADPQVRTVSPWGIVLHAGTSYLVGYDHDREAVRTFKLARIVGQPKPAKGLEFVEPADEDPQSLVASALAEVAESDDLDTQVRKAILASGAAASGSGETQARTQDTSGELRAAVNAALAATSSAQGELDKLRESGALDEDLARLAKARKSARRVAPQDSSTRFTRILTIVPWLVQNQGVPTAVAAQEFGITEEQLVKDLNLAYCTEFGFDNVAMDLYIHSTLQVLDPQGIDRPLRFSVSEAYALQLGLLKLQQLPGLVESDAIVSAEEKLASATGVQPGAIQLATQDPDINSGFLAEINKALANSEVLELSYAGSLDPVPTRRQVAPRSVSSVDGHNYLAAWCLEAEGVRHFRFDRIQQLTSTGTHFDPTAYMTDEFETKPLGNVTDYAVLRVDSSVAWWVDTIHDSVSVPSTDGNQLVSVPLVSSEWLAKSVAGFAGDIQIVAPPELVDNFHHYLNRSSPL